MTVQVSKVVMFNMDALKNKSGVPFNHRDSTLVLPGKPDAHLYAEGGMSSSGVQRVHA